MSVQTQQAATPTRRRSRFSLPATASAIVAAALAMLPVLWMVSGSLRPQEDFFASLADVSWRMFVPTDFTLDNYIAMITGDFGRALGVSLVVCILTVAVGLVVGVAAAYAVAVLPFRGRNVVFSIIVISFLVPFDAIAIPLSQLFTEWGLANTLIALVLPGIGNGLAIFNLRQHFRAIPPSYREAGKIDGASEPRILWSLYLPQSGSTLVNSALLLFLGQWTAYLWPLLIISDSSLQVAPVELAQTFGEQSSNFSENFAGSVMLALIPAVLLFIMQRLFGGISIETGEK